MMQEVAEDMEALQKKLKAPGELKEIFRRLCSAGKTCACRRKNCFNYVNNPPNAVFDIMDESNLQYCGMAKGDAPSDRLVYITFSF